MTKPECYWLSLDPNSPTSGYWDQGIVKLTLDGRLWPSEPLVAGHHEVTELPEADVAAVVIPGARNVDHFWQIAKELEKIARPVVFITSDEESLFPWWQFSHEEMRLWVQTPKPEHLLLQTAGGVRPRWLPEGFAEDTLDQVDTLGDLASDGFEDRPIDVVLMGQETHDRRREAFGAVRAVPGDRHTVVLGTNGFAQGLGRRGYLSLMSKSRVAPCPSGPVSVDTFRCWEALECGCTPIFDDGGSGFWDGTKLAGPIPRAGDWSEMIREALDDPAPGGKMVWRNICAGAWWQDLKRSLYGRMAWDLEQAASDWGVTILMTTSPIESHPDISIIQETLRSAQALLPYSPVAICADGVRPEQEHLRNNYFEYLARLLHWIRRDHIPAVLSLSSSWGHQANSVRQGLDLVETEHILFVEHDTPIVNSEWIDVGLILYSFGPEVVDGSTDYDYDVVRLYHEAIVQPEHQAMMMEEWPNQSDSAITRTSQWSQRPHFAGSDFYRDMLEYHFPHESRTMIEDLMHGVLVESSKRGAHHPKVGIYSFGGLVKFSDHLDGRGSEPKFDMDYGR